MTSVLLLAGGTPKRDRWEEFRKSPRVQVDIERIPELGYSDAPPEPERLAHLITDKARELWGTKKKALYHFHNHSLGKNLSMPGAVLNLAKNGEHLLLHIHDFAEDRRPRNYASMLNNIAAGESETLGRVLYPAYSNVHFALLNRRDLRILRSSGVRQERLHLLPNAARQLRPESDPEECRKRLARLIGRVGDRELTPHHRFFLYPARAIRRKNIGEALLWSALSPEDCWFGMSLVPRNPRQRSQYERWRAFAAEARLPFRLGLADEADMNFLDYVAAAHAALTTSIAEGFGLTFLEPWTARRPVVGRDLPWVTADLKDNGLRLGHLYRSLRVPLEWVGARVLRERTAAALESSYRRYGGSLPPRAVDLAVEANSTGDYVDFGFLDEELQVKVIEHVLAGDRARTRVLAANPALGHALARSGGRWRATIAHNCEIVRREYSIEKYGKRLRGIYDVLSRTAEGECDAPTRSRTKRLLDFFLKPQSFRLLRS